MAEELDWRRELDAESEETDRLLEMAQSAIEESRARRGAHPRQNQQEPALAPVRDSLRSWFSSFEAEKKDPNAGRVATTGLSSLDSATKLRPGEMTIIAGRPGMGKSVLATQLALATARAGGVVALFSLEMSKEILATRMVSAESRTNLRGNIGSEDWSKITRACDRLSMLPVFLDDRAGLSCDRMRKALLGIEPPKLIVVDYLGLMAQDKSAQRNDIAVGNNARDLRALAKDFKAHVLALCQLNRKVEERNPPRPQLSDLRDSGNLEEHADNVWMIYREGYYRRDATDSTADIQIEKQRQGERSVVKLSWQGKYQMFAELEKQRDWKAEAAGERTVEEF